MKKILAMLLALMLLAVPFAGVAEEAEADSTLDMLKELYAAAETNDPYTQALENGRRITTTITVDGVAESFTGDEITDQAIRDLLDALVITTYSQNDEEYFSLGMKQADGSTTDLLNFGYAGEGDVAYIATNLIGGTIAVSAEEVQPLLERLIDMLVLIGMYTEEDAAALKTQLPELLETYTEQMGNAFASTAQELDIFALDYSAFTDVLTPILERVQTGEVTMQPKNCDPAASVLTASVTGEEMEALLVSLYRFIQQNPELMAYVQSSYDSTMAEYAALYPEEELPSFEESLEQAITEMQEEIQIEGETTLSLYLDEEGAPVYALIELPEQSAYDEEAVAETVTHTYVPTITYTRLTMNDSRAHSVVMIVDDVDVTVNLVEKDETITMNMACAEAGETMLALELVVTDRSVENVSAFDMFLDLTVVDDEQYSYEYNAETGTFDSIKLDPVTTQITLKLTSETVELAGDFTDKTSATIGVNGTDYCTIHVETASGEPGASIKEGEVARPAAMSDADFANWFVGVYNGLQSWLFTAIQALPASITNLLMY